VILGPDGQAWRFVLPVSIIEADLWQNGPAQGAIESLYSGGAGDAANWDACANKEVKELSPLCPASSSAVAPITHSADIGEEDTRLVAAACPVISSATGNVTGTELVLRFRGHALMQVAGGHAVARRE